MPGKNNFELDFLKEDGVKMIAMSWMMVIIVVKSLENSSKLAKSAAKMSY